MAIATATQSGEVRTAFGFKKTVALEDGTIECWGYGEHFQWLYFSRSGERLTDGKTYTCIGKAITAAKKFLQNLPEEKSQVPRTKELEAKLRQINKLRVKWEALSK